jgi:hypothetical protein
VLRIEQERESTCRKGISHSNSRNQTYLIKLLVIRFQGPARIARSGDFWQDHHGDAFDAGGVGWWDESRKCILTGVKRRA